MRKFKIAAWIVLGFVPLFFYSCQHFDGEREAEEHSVVIIEKNKTEGCSVTLYSDGEYVSKVNVESCRIYVQTINYKEK